MQHISVNNVKAGLKLSFASIRQSHNFILAQKSQTTHISLCRVFFFLSFGYPQKRPQIPFKLKFQNYFIFKLHILVPNTLNILENLKILCMFLNLNLRNAYIPLKWDCLAHLSRRITGELIG